MTDEIKILCKYDEMVPINELKPFDKNRNKHSEDQYRQFEKIIEYQGVRLPIICNRDKIIATGHGRWEVFKRLKMTHVPVVYQDFKDEDQFYAFVQSDNGISQQSELDLAGINLDLGDLGPDFDIDWLGIKDFEIEPADKYAEKDADETPETPVDPVSKFGDLYELGEHRLLCGDSTGIDAVQAILGKLKAAMLFTDPPYRQALSGGGMADRRPGWKKNQDNGLSEFDPNDFLQVLSAINVPTCYIFCSKDLLVDYMNWVKAESRGWNLLVMRKKNPIPLKNNTFLSDTEWLVFSRGSNAKFNNNLDYDYYRKVFDTEVRKSEYGHPTEKRVSICQRFIEISSEKGDIVLDLFGGSGSTLIACEKTNRKCFMMELEPKYIDVIVSRYVKFTGNDKVIRNGEEITWTV